MSSDTSDYKKKRIDIEKLFSSPLLTKTNKALANNVFNRFLSKEELKKVTGIIGEKTDNSEKYHISETTTQKSAFQLQPMVIKKVATENYMLSYNDITQRLRSNGVDKERTSDWGSTEQFNFIPPIDLDKFTNYTNYYWYNPNDVGSNPQYITIKNKCALAQSALNAKITELGGVLQHNISSLNSSNQYIEIPGNFINVFIPTRQFQIETSTNNNGTFTTVSAQYIGANTRVYIIEAINDSIIDGYITFSSEVDQFFAERDCYCYGSVGFGDYAYDTFTFDSSSSCIVQTDAWYKDNFWVHILDLPPSALSFAIRAEMPIIEYLSSIEMNSWSYTKYKWKYRKTPIYTWNDSIIEPSITELNTFYPILLVNGGLQTITLDSSVGDLTLLFVSGFNFSVENTNSNRYVTGLFEVASSSFVGTNTIITTTVPFNGIGQPVANIGFNIVPIVETSVGDPWLGFFKHWTLVGEYETVPHSDVIINPTIIYDEFLTPDFSIVGLDATGPIGSHKIEVNGNYTSLFTAGYIFDIVDSINNNGQFTTNSSIYIGTKTIITVVESINDIIVDGEILSNNTFYFTGNNDQLAIYQSDSIRVYINDVRTYTTYTELPIIQPNGIFPNTKPSGVYVDGIIFDSGFPKLTKVKIGINAASVYDISREAVMVRTDLSDITFTTPETVSLIQYRKTEQLKNYGETKYPLFNIYNVDGSFYGVSEIWKFQEAQDSPINSNTGFRILISESGKVYHFEQLLLNDETGEMYVYRDLSTISIDNPQGFQTIWRIGFDGADVYTPKFVNKYREEVLLTDPSGDWEIPHQLYFNPNHENKKYLTSSELLQHFRSIIHAQQTPSLYQNNVDFPWRVITTPNYGLGGSIKEHNNSYDSTISTILTNNSPINIIEFAQDRYEKNISFITNSYTSKLTKYLTTNDPNYITDISSSLTNLIINTFEFNDINNKIYGDSNTYNEITNIGIKGWIATLPFIRMSFKYKPNYILDELLGINEISSHDNHLFNCSLDNSFINNVISDVISTLHPINGVWGISQPTQPPNFYNTYATFGGSIGKYWFDQINSILYRFEVISVGLVSPSNPPLNAMWFDTGTNLLKVNNGLSWINVSGIPNDITQAWSVIDIQQIYAELILEVENRLYNAAPNLTNLAYEISLLESDPNYQTYLEEEFLNLMTVRGNSTPYSVDNYYISIDAFTWNYKDVNVNDVNYPTIATNTNKPWGSTWWDIYLKIFNTYYPHLEPWKLQGYIDKPTWWNSYYLWTIDNSRRWQPIMWTNIQGGIVPIGELLPNNTISVGIGGQVTQYSHMCVDITNDELLPPYISASSQTLINNIVYIPITIDDEYTFGENGPIEWEWKKSTQYLYDRLKVAYRLQPIKFFHNTFGEKYYNIGGLQVNQRTKNVYSHKSSIFHGDMLNETISYIVDGLNQWYVNFNRSIDLDHTVSSFRQLWTEWDIKLSYQFDAFINIQSFRSISKFFDMADNDFEIIIKKSEGVRDYWADSIQIINTKYSPKRISGDNGDDWEFIINIPSTSNREIEFYNVNTSSLVSQFFAFNASNTSEAWNHYEINKMVINKKLTPFTIIGIQNVINFIDGYSEFLKDLGFIFNNTDAIEQDNLTGRTISWQFELESFIDQIYSARNLQRKNKEVEINPFRNNIWFNNSNGVISNVVTGPYNSSVKRENTLYDQDGKIIKAENIQVYRQDNIGHISLLDDPENTQAHIGGLHLFLDDYEHVILFNDYTIDDNLIYDKFLGINVPRLYVDFDSQIEKTQRPNVGGMFLNKNNITKNIEASIDDISLYYDTNIVNENSNFITDARSLLGYDKNELSFLDHIFVNDKSKFLFWRGMIQNKGSINSVKAFLNAKTFVDAIVDEFWAYKVGEFGEADRRVYPELKLNVNDIINDKLLFEFTELLPTQNFISVSHTDQERWFEWTDQLEKLLANKLLFDAEVTSKITSPTPEINNIFKTDVICDDIRVPFYQGYVKYTKPLFAGSVVTLSFNYIIGGSNIEVFFNGIKTYNYIETSTNQITFNSPFLNSDVVIVIRKPGVLPILETQRINSMLYNIPNYSTIGTFSIYTLNAAKSKISPSKVIDYVSNVVLNEVPLWNPALNHHSHVAINDVDYNKPNDPANYSNTFEDINYDTTMNFWSDREVGRIWIDSSNIGYKHYYDNAIMSNIEDRINNWGAISNWGSIDAYEWSESESLPKDYSKSGNIKLEVYKRTRDYDYISLEKAELCSCKVSLLNNDFGTISNTDETGLTTSDYYLNLILNNSLISQQIINIVVNGQLIQNFLQLIEEINLDLPNTVKASLLGDGIIFEATDPSIRTIDVVANESEKYDLLYSLTKNLIPLYGKRYDILQHYPTNKFIIDGNFTSVFTPLTNFNVYDTNNSLNNGIYVVSSSSFISGKTEIIITSSIVSDSGGVIFVQAGTLTKPVPTTIDSYLTNLSYPCTQGITLTIGMSIFIKDVVGLPEELSEGNIYYIVNNPNNIGELLLSTDVDGINIIKLTEFSTIIVMNVQWTNSWNKDKKEHAEFLPAIESLNVTLKNPNIKPCDVVKIYRNGIFEEEQSINTLGFITPTFVYNTITIGLNTFIIDTIHVVKYTHILTNEERNFNPDIEDIGIFLTQYHEDYEYTSKTSTNKNGIKLTKYYFWIKDKGEKFENNKLSAKEISIQLRTIPTPYMFVQNLTRGYKAEDSISRTIIIPDNYNQLIIRGLTNKISNNERYKLRLLQDFSLRDNYNDFIDSHLDLKNKHEEWIMFREKQLSKVNKTLWDRLVESLIGYTLNSFENVNQIVVPSLERQLYDEQYGTDTQYGLGEGQAFVNKEVGVNTLVSLLETPTFEISPIDKDVFLDNYYFNTPTNIRDSLDYIYDNFTTEAVNKIYFEILHDSFSMKKKYEELMKTSFIAMTGVQLLETPETIINVL